MSAVRIAALTVHCRYMGKGMMRDAVCVQCVHERTAHTHETFGYSKVRPTVNYYQFKEAGTMKIGLSLFVRGCYCRRRGCSPLSSRWHRRRRRHCRLPLLFSGRKRCASHGSRYGSVPDLYVAGKVPFELSLLLSLGNETRLPSPF